MAHLCDVEKLIGMCGADFIMALEISAITMPQTWMHPIRRKRS